MAEEKTTQQPSATEKKLKEMLEGIVNPLIERVEAKVDEKMGALTAPVDHAAIMAEVEAKVKELIKPDNSIKRIEIYDNLIDDPKGGFKCLSLFASDVAKSARAIRSGQVYMSKELSEWDRVTNHGTMEKAAGTGMATDDNEYGGYLIPPQFRNEIMSATREMNEILPRCMPVPMERNIVEIPTIEGFDQSGATVWGGIKWYWLDEEAQLTETRPKVGRIQLKLKKVAGLAFTTGEIISDSPISMEGILRQGFAQGLNFCLNNVLIRGTGAGQPLGILNAPCAVSVAKEAGQAASTIVWENVIKMYSRCYNVGGAVWVINPDCLPQLCSMSLAVGTGGVPVYMPANGAVGSPPGGTLLGRPVIWNDHCSALGTVGDINLVDWSQYLLAQKAGAEGGVSFDTSIHLKFD